MKMESIQCDILVIGCGIAGLTFALKSSLKHPDSQILITCKDEVGNCNTRLAQGGVACVLDSSKDSVDAHISDTITAGAGLCDPEVVRMVAESGPNLLRELMVLGLAFDANEYGGLDLVKEGGHSASRILHIKDYTGLGLHSWLINKLKRQDNVKFMVNYFAVDLMKGRRGRCVGSFMLSNNGLPVQIRAKLTVLATGGAGKIYSKTTNAEGATGDGIAMAHRAKAEVSHMAFIQFHPTAFYKRNMRKTSFLISEALRGAGAELRNSKGEKFMQNYDIRGSMGTRDIVCQAIFEEIKRAKVDHVFLDATGLDIDELKSKFPVIYSSCQENGIDPKVDFIPVAPAAHYFCGGVRTDQCGRTNIAGLLCIGESAYSGMHGANRLASNSLLEAIVFAHNASVICGRYLTSSLGLETQVPQSFQPVSNSENTEKILSTVQQLMSAHLGIIRNRVEVSHCLGVFKKLRCELKLSLNRKVIELANVLDIAILISEDSLRRTIDVGGLKWDNVQ